MLRGEPAPLRDLPPKEWREGDVLECVSQHERWSENYTIGKTYKVWNADGSDRPGILSDRGIELYPYASDFRFHSRP